MAEVKVAANLWYTRKHEWVKIEGDVAQIGISDFAQSALGDIVFLDLFSNGSKVSKGDSIGTIESVKAADDIYSPISGEVVEVNQSLIADPSLINKDCYSAWMVKIKKFDLIEVQALMEHTKYKEFTLTLD
jgi:glycine cleavage system H protein